MSDIWRLRRLALLGLLACFATWLSRGAAVVDFDGDGLSDVWEAAFDAKGLDPDGDADGDGFSNREECEHGTDPFDAESRFRFIGIEAADTGVAFRFEGAERQSYYLEVSDDLVKWDVSEDVLVSSGGEERLAATGDGKVRFLRFRIGADQDHDGLSDYEEGLLGYDLNSQHSDPLYEGGDMARLVAALTGGESIALEGGEQLSGPELSLAEASRFLMQASLGATMEEIEAVAEMGFEAWLEAEFGKAPSSMEVEIDARREAGLNVFNHHRHRIWWNQYMNSQDALRQRMAVALSEIYVISDQALDGDASTVGIANYYDMLLGHAFGNWRELLRDVSLHPTVGTYLSHLQNEKANPGMNRYPDENYAREVMQLFSIGLFELNQDGTRKQDEDGYDIPTYDNTDITNFARVFTGFSFGGMQYSDNQPPRPKDPNNFLDFWGSMVWNEPMMAWETFHDTDEKTLLRGTVLPSWEEDPSRTTMDDFEDAIDNLYEHPNVGPFISYRLIQRLVKSNPSPGYVERVAGVFNDNGRGVKGDMKSVVKAILLDAEARSTAAAMADEGSGRLREPFLRWVRLVKGLQPTARYEFYNISDWDADSSMEQKLFSSRSVFNFFMPDYLPEGEMAEAGLVGPEFQILTSTTAMAAQNHWGPAFMWGFGWADEEWREQGVEGATMFFDFEPEVALLDAGDLEGLIERWDVLLMAGSMSEGTKSVLRDAYAERNGWFDNRMTVAVLARLVALSPDFAVVR